MERFVGERLVAALTQGQGGGFARPVSGLAGSSLSWLAAHLTGQARGVVVLVTHRTARAEALQREMLFFTRGWRRPLAIHPFPAWETLPFERLSPFGPLVADRLATLFRLAQMQGLGPTRPGDEEGHARAVVVTTPMALMQRLPPREVLSRHGFTIAVGDQLDVDAFRQFLAVAGYRAVAQVEEPGEFAVRGGIVDFFPAGSEEPVRIELMGDEVEHMRRFDPMSQRSGDATPALLALPACEVILDEEAISAFRVNFRATFGGQAAEDEIYKLVSQGQKAQGMEHFLPLFYERCDTLFDYLPPGSILLLDHGVEEAALAFAREIAEQHHQTTVAEGGHRCLPANALYLDKADLDALLAGQRLLRGQEGAPDTFAFAPTPSPAVGDTEKRTKTYLTHWSERLDDLRKQGYRLVAAARTMGQRERLREMLADHRIPVRLAETWDEAVARDIGAVNLVVGDVQQGFLHAGLRLLLLSEEELLGTRVRTRQVDRRYLDQIIASFATLGENDLVVHADHGIGRYSGLHTLTLGELKNDFLLITYAEGDKLYVPVENLDLVSKYSGGEGAVLDKLGSNRWEKTKLRARKKILEMAAELVQLQALREAHLGFAFSRGLDPLYQEFASGFPYEETPDQATAIEAVLGDMASRRPMDRLVCGDVGFGKTEVALRAAFRAVEAGKQVAVLVPTTILAQQHYETFTRRFTPFPMTVELLSRFRTAREQKKAIDTLTRGGVDVIIGTHRLLQDDVVFKDLGLLIIDEEQRFGVTHKEKLKSFRASVDILTLTATPIPRTLNLALAGIRDISIIATPPPDRLAIRTIITQYGRQQVREAILREIYRGGQVFFVHNQVQEIERIASNLAELVPEARIGVAHGQMRENQLERIMLSFYHQEFNVLVCSTIIENGVDIPTANTIIINRADRFGLAQLHQLRGRVGRSKHRAYAYLLIPPRERLAPDAKKRLEAIETLGELGAGFMLATHDMEIRGVGNILGDEQSGEIREVGLELYNQMLAEAVQALKSGQGLPALEEPGEGEPAAPVIQLHISTYIPDRYVPDVHQRLSFYKRIAGLVGGEELSGMRAELLDRFGPLPEAVENLFKVMEFKGLCRQLRITKVEAGPKGGAIQFHAQPLVDPGVIIRMVRQGGGRVKFDPQGGVLKFLNQEWKEPAARLREIMDILGQLRG